MPDVLVVNASPLIFLGNAGRIDLLRLTGSRVIVPQAVFDEVTTTHHDDRAARSIAESDWIERFASIDIPSEVTEWDLGSGESAVIALASRYLRPNQSSTISPRGGARSPSGSM